MIYGPMDLQLGTRIALAAPPPKDTKYNKEHWVKFGTITSIRGSKLNVQCDDNTLLWVSKMGKRIVGTLREDAPFFKGVMPKKDILCHIQIHNTNIDNRTTVAIRESFDNTILDSVAIYDLSVLNNQSAPEGANGPILIYPTCLRFEVGDIIRAHFLLEKFEVRRTDTEGYAKIVKKSLKAEPIGNQSVMIPTYTVERAYKGITTEDYNQQHVIRDVKIKGQQTMISMPDAVQTHVRKEFFDIYNR